MMTYSEIKYSCDECGGTGIMYIPPCQDRKGRDEACPYCDGTRYIVITGNDKNDNTAQPTYSDVDT